MKKYFWIILIVIAAAGSYFFIIKKDDEKGISFSTEQVHTGYIDNSVTATGTIEPVDTVAVGARISGTIQNIYVDFNSAVKKGQLLATLDKSLFLDQVNQDMANLQNAEDNFQFQQKNFNRQNELFKAGAISKSDFEVAQSTYNSSVAQVKNANAVLSEAQRNLSFTNIYSPINGTVLSRNVSEGQTVASSFNTPTLFSIARDLRKMQVRASVDEADIGNVKNGQPVSFTVDAFPNDVFSGVVEEVRLQPVVIANVVTYVTIIDAGNNDMKLKPGMTANITIYIQRDSSANLISSKALSFNPDSSLTKQYQIMNPSSNKDVSAENNGSNDNQPLTSQNSDVWVLKGNKIVKKNILIGMNDNVHVQVLSGLSQNDRVIDEAEEGTSVKPGEGPERSPFMPSRRRAPKKKTAGTTR